jgi:hypothetical protein
VRPHPILVIPTIAKDHSESVLSFADHLRDLMPNKEDPPFVVGLSRVEDVVPHPLTIDPGFMIPKATD